MVSSVICIDYINTFEAIPVMEAVKARDGNTFTNLVRHSITRFGEECREHKNYNLNIAFKIKKVILLIIKKENKYGKTFLCNNLYF